MVSWSRGRVSRADGSLLIISHVLGMLLLLLKDHAILLSSLLCLIHRVPFLRQDSTRVTEHESFFALVVRTSNDNRTISLASSSRQLVTPILPLSNLNYFFFLLKAV